MEEDGTIWLLSYFKQICLRPLKNETVKKILEWWFIRKNKSTAMELLGNNEELTPDIVKEWSAPELNKMYAGNPTHICRMEFVNGCLLEKQGR